jgi:hypothetical protein
MQISNVEVCRAFEGYGVLRFADSVSGSDYTS